MRKINITSIWLLATGYWLLFSASCFAEKITILYTGRTHASLYHCDCPKEPDGGLARRMTKIKQLRAENPNTLLLEAGGFFAGGMLDEHSQGIELDKMRSEINLRALELMGYDALNIGDDEFNFGKDYLEGQIKKSRLLFLSSNLKMDGVRPYAIKKIGDTNIAIIGLINEEAKIKAGGLELEEAKPALLKTIQEVKKEGAGLILCLSYLGEERDRALLGEVKDIDILIPARPTESPDNYTRIGSSYIVRPAWQARRLSKIDLELENRRIKEFRLEQIRLSEEIAEAPEITGMMPQCFSDADCFENGVRGSCHNPAKLQSSCSYAQPKPISLLIVQPKDAKMPHQGQFIGFLKSLFPGLDSTVIDYGSDEGRAWADKIKAKLLPVYLLAKAAESEAGFKKIQEYAELKGDYFYLKPGLAGGSIFAGRQAVPGRLDVFLASHGKNTGGILSVLKQLQAKHKDRRVSVHYLAVEGPAGFSAPGGLAELEEDLRNVCVGRYYPQKLWDYAMCRAQYPQSSWWDVCAEQYALGAQKIKKCALSEEGVSLLRENTKLNKELEIANGPTFLVNNYEVFSVNGVPSVEQLEERLGLSEVAE